MASSTGGSVSGYGYNWYSYLYVSEASRTSTTISYYVEAGFYTNQRIAENAFISSNVLSWSGSLNSMGQSNGSWNSYYLTSRTVTYDLGASASQETIWVSLTTNGGFSNGTSTASLKVDIPQRTYSLPNPPRNFAATYVSDKNVKLTWTGDYTSATEDKPWTGLYVERRTDGGAWATIATISWNATSYSDITTSAGHAYIYRVRSYNNAGATASGSITVYTSPTSFGSIVAALPSASALTLTPKSLPKYYDGVEFQVTTDGKTWSQKSVTLSAAGVWTDTTPPSGTATYRGRAFKAQGSGTLYSAWATSNQIVTLQAPLAPSLMMFESVYTIDTTLDVTWTPNHLDGAVQAKAQIEVVTPGDETTTYEVTGDTANYVLELVTAGTYKVRVRTYGLYDAWGAWSSYSAFAVANLPRAWFTFPTRESNTATILPFDVHWECADDTGIAYLELSILDIYGNTLLSKNLDTDATSYTVDSTVGLTTGNEYVCSLFVRGGSDLTATVTQSFTTSWAAPEKPTCTITYDDNFAAHILIAENFFTAGTYKGVNHIIIGPMNRSDESHILIGGETEYHEDSGMMDIHNLPATTSYALIRDTDERRTVLMSQASAGEEFIDYLPPLNTDYTYTVVAYSEVGSSTQAEFEAYCDSDGYEAFNFGENGETALLVRYNAKDSETSKHSGESFHFALGDDEEELPTFYPDGDIDVTGSRSYVVLDLGTYKKVRSLARANPLGWFRGYYGSRARVKSDWSLGYEAKAYNQWSVDADITEVAWTEPENVG